MKSRIKILIVDDHAGFRRTLATFISSIDNFVVVGEAENGSDALKLINLFVPDIVLLDIQMPVLDGFETALKIHSQFFGVKVIFLTMYKDSAFQNLLPELNVHGYIVKDDAFAEIFNCIEKVMDGSVYISPAVERCSY